MYLWPQGRSERPVLSAWGCGECEGHPCQGRQGCWRAASGAFLVRGRRGGLVGWQPQGLRPWAWKTTALLLGLQLAKERSYSEFLHRAGVRRLIVPLAGGGGGGGTCWSNINTSGFRLSYSSFEINCTVLYCWHKSWRKTRHGGEIISHQVALHKSAPWWREIYAKLIIRTDMGKVHFEPVICKIYLAGCAFSSCHWQQKIRTGMENLQISSEWKMEEWLTLKSSSSSISRS